MVYITLKISFYQQNVELKVISVNYQPDYEQFNTSHLDQQ